MKSIYVAIILISFTLVGNAQNGVVGTYTPSGDFIGITTARLDLNSDCTFNYDLFSHSFAHIRISGMYKCIGKTILVQFEKIHLDTIGKSQPISLKDTINLPIEFLLKKNKEWIDFSPDVLIKCEKIVNKSQGYKIQGEYYVKHKKFFLKKRTQLVINKNVIIRLIDIEIIPPFYR